MGGTPGGVWVIPAIIGMYVASVLIRWAVNRRQRARRGWGDWDHLFNKDGR